MRFRSRHSLLALWIGLVFLVPGLGVVHALPHAHAEGTHPVSEPAPAPASQRDHGHGHDHGHPHGHEDPPAAAEESHHHHTLDDHFESDPLRLQKRSQNPAPDRVMVEVLIVDAPMDTFSSTTVVVEQPASKTARPPGATVARAPPVQH